MKKAIVFLAVLLAFGCNKQTESDDLGNFDYFIFGKANGFCVGNCVTVFKLEGDNLFPDDDASYTTLAGQDIPFQTTSLPSDKVALAKTLFAQIPTQLFDLPDGNVGCPDCRDQGLYYVKIKTGNTIREWRIDRDQQEYAAFCELIYDITEQLK